MSTAFQTDAVFAGLLIPSLVDGPAEDVSVVIGLDGR